MPRATATASDPTSHCGQGRMPPLRCSQQYDDRRGLPGLTGQGHRRLYVQVHSRDVLHDDARRRRIRFTRSYRRLRPSS